MTVLGLDIGGANIKAATADGRCAELPFPLWKQPERLAGTLADLLARWPDVERVALTMTGELADCYVTKAEGVAHIVQATAATRKQVGIWTTEGKFVTPEEACEQPLQTAAANWHALATWITQRFPTETGLLFDMGSTTTDLIPFRNGAVVAMGQTDLTRLQSGELLYTGARRTPLCAVLSEVELDQRGTPVAAEWFATMLDVYVWLGDIPEEPDNCDTADGRPATRHHARNRLAHMVCCDATELTDEQLTLLARQFVWQQQTQIQSCLTRLCARLEATPSVLVTSGAGEFFSARYLTEFSQVLMVKRWSLTEELGAKIATCACAYAVAQLASDKSSLDVQAHQA